MELTQLEYFYSVARTQSISRSADDLSVTAPALSAAIKRLEDELGTKLFERSVGGIHLNEYGKQFYDTVKKSLFLLNASRQQLGTAQSKKEKTYSIYIGMMNPASAVADCFAAFMQRSPSTILHLIDPMLISDSSIRSAMDFLVGDPGANMLIPSSYEKLFLKRLDRYALLPKDHPLAQKKTVDIRDLKNDSWTASNKRQDEYRPHTSSICETGGFTPNIRFYCNDYISRRTAVAEAHMTGLSNSCDLPFYRCDDVVPVPLKNQQPFCDCCLCYPSSDALMPHTRAFLDFVRSFYQN